MMHTYLVIVRHGETDWNKSGRWQGHAPVPLNAEGHKQARMVAEYLAGAGSPLPGRAAALYSSDLSRAVATARLIADALGQPVRLDSRWREIDLGDWQGLTRDEIRAWDAARLEMVNNGGHDTQRPGGESPNQVAARAMAAAQDILAAHPGQTVLVVSHGGTIRSLLRGLGVLDGTWDIVDNTSITILAYGAHGWRVEAFNKIDHLHDRRLAASKEG